MSPRKTTATEFLVTALLGAMGIGLLFWPWLSGSEVPAFRDSGHFYYRLFAWNQAEWQDGRIPLWNPHENLGIPQLADASSSALYPVKLLFHVPGLSYATQYNLYLLVHIYLGLLGAYCLARNLRASLSGAWLAAICFALSGAMLTQVSNAVFLVGAAWLPWGLLVARQVICRPRVLWMATLALCLAMVVLGGDPQMAYHVVLGSVLMACVMGRRQLHVMAGSAGSIDESAMRSLWKTRWMRIGALLGSAVVAIALSAIQVWPSLEWNAQSARAAYLQPRSVFEIAPHANRVRDREGEVSAGRLFSDSIQGIMGEPQLGAHQDHAYQFSVPPWTLWDCLWPNASGKMYPEHRRWANAIPGADRVWLPSLYFGIVPFVLACSIFSLRSRSGDRRWLSWLATLSLLGALGWFGLGWLIREIMWGLGGTPPNEIHIGSPVGGIYWLLVTFLPAYAQFRYPAKLFVVTTLAFAILAALGWDRLKIAWRPALKVAIGYLSMTFTLLLTSFVLAGVWNRLLESRADDPVFGPLDRAGSLIDLRASLLQGAISAGLLVGMVWFIRTQSKWRWAGGLFMAAVVGADLSLANRWITATAPAESWARPSAVDLLADDRRLDDGTTPRIYRGNLLGWTPKSFATERSPDRLEELIRWDTSTLFSKHSLPFEIGQIESYSSITPLDYQIFINTSRSLGPPRSDGWQELSPNVLEALSVESVLVPDEAMWQDEGNAVSHDRVVTELAEDARLVDRPRRFPRCWLVDDIVPMESPAAGDLIAMELSTWTVLWNGGEMRDLRTQATVEWGDEIPDTMPTPGDGPAGRCEIVEYTPQSVMCMVETQRPMLMVLNDQFAPGWRATLKDSTGVEVVELPIYRTNRVMRGVVLPAGRSVVIFEYDPASFRWGALISGITWLLLFAATLADLIAQRQAQRLR